LSEFAESTLQATEWLMVFHPERPAGLAGASSTGTGAGGAGGDRAAPGHDGRTMAGGAMCTRLEWVLLMIIFVLITFVLITCIFNVFHSP